MNGSNSRQLLQSLVNRLCEVQDRIDEARDDRKDILTEAKGLGFSTTALTKAVKRKRETDEERAKREEVEALTDLYCANLGFLGGTPLGEAARRRLSTDQKHDAKATTKDVEPHDDGADADPEPNAPETIDDDAIAVARARGVSDAEAGKKILENPYTAGDPRRAAWDEGWCEQTGSDGMDLPEAWKPKKRPKKGDGEGGEI